MECRALVIGGGICHPEPTTLSQYRQRGFPSSDSLHLLIRLAGNLARCTLFHEVVSLYLYVDDIHNV